MKNIMISTAFAALTATGAVAQGAMFHTDAEPQALAASDFIGMRVYASEVAVSAEGTSDSRDGREDIGEIHDVILSRDGVIESVLVDVGGFLGIGERQVALDMGSIRFVSDVSTEDDPDDFFLVINAAASQIEQAPEFHWATDQQQAAVTEQAEGTAKPMAQAGDGTQLAAGPQTDNTMRIPIEREGWDKAAPEELTAEMLTGARAYDSTDDWVGEVSQLNLGADGQIDSVVVDVGGFLGIGEKPVELPLDKIDILRLSGGDDLRVYLPMTEQELEAMPTFEG